MLISSRRAALALAWLVMASSAHAGVTPDLQRALREGTFEVVIKKPEHGAVVYEKPLPLELLPYIERTDPYRSVGTAFALGHNTYVTAAHVIQAGIASQFGAPALRRADGAVFEIDRILKFSEHEDFVVFSLQKDPAAAPLSVNRTPALDQPVLAVGNALGEGIVIRDGLLTSQTPEAQDGRWKWIRFSAAASPGNSGGPLCDADGKVIGVVVRKSPNENLNYALPIARVLDAQDLKARFDQKLLVGLPYLHGTATYAYKDEFKLPLSWPAFVQAYQELIERHARESRALVLSTYAETLFPRGPGADDVLYDPPDQDSRPRFIHQEPDGTWSARTPEFNEVDLPGDGRVAVTTVADARLLRIIRPGSASDDAFYGDSRAFMDLALKALDLKRSVGTDGVRIVSLGPATSESLYTDPYGRKWQQRIWPVPFQDAYLVGELLPTPDGYVALLMWAPSIALRTFEAVSQLMAGQLDASYEGTLAQWQAALRRSALLPQALAGVRLDPGPLWTLHARRFTSSVPAEVLALNDRSPMTLVMGFMKDGARTVWDAQGVWWNQDDRRDAAVGIWRRARPPAGARLELRNGFEGIRARRAPYDGTFLRETAETLSASMILDVPGRSAGSVSSDLEYGITLHLLGYPSLMDADRSLKRVAQMTHLLEKGVGADVAATRQASPLDQAFATLESQLMAKADDPGAGLGKDLRGKSLADDVHDLVQQMKSDMAAMHLSASQDGEQYLLTQTERASWLQSYWSLYPRLQRNRDMWSEFIAKNHLAASTPHDPAVAKAREALLGALAKPPSADWVQRARELDQAYVKERGDYLRAHVPDVSTLAPRAARRTPCPPPAPLSSAGKQPKFLRSARPLDEMYPSESRRLGEEGTVLAAIDISETGCVTAKAIVGWSGSDLLDTAVLDWLETVEFIPAAADGHGIASTQVMPIVFKLQNE
ncbi:MAG TPA: TonB family protein [Steroidobacteraceae bacterium]|nr:TonB family protein [Steroidobacteraceae bacterium]